MDTVEQTVLDSDNSQKKKRQPRYSQQVIAHPGCDCEYQYRDYTWKKFTDYEPSRHGVEVREFYVVNVAGKELFTYVEGAVGNTRTETKFPYVCGEVVSSKKMASAGKLKNVYTWVQMTPEQIAGGGFLAHNSANCNAGVDGDGGVVRFSDEGPLHVRQRYETNANRTLTGLPLVVDRHSKVVVFRMQGDFLYIQLMPTLHSEYKLIPGTPLFDKNNRGVRAVIGNMFSQNDYVVNCAPIEFCEIPTYSNKHGSDRLRLICLDRRGRPPEDRPHEYKETTGGVYRHTGSILSSLVNMGVEAVMGGVNVNGANAITTAFSADDVASESSENELLFDGVVNNKFQIVDTYSFDKKNKPPELIVTVVIDDLGVSVRYQSGDKATVNWVHRDPNVLYSIMPRRFFNAKASVVSINTTALRSAKKEQRIKRHKSLERLI